MTIWSPQQERIFKETAEGTEHVVVDAKAGSGKTTTLIESIKHIPAGKSWLLVAFNKRNAEELKFRAPTDQGGAIYTLHALGLKTVGGGFPRTSVNQEKLSDIVERVVGRDRDMASYRVSLAKAASLAKATLTKKPEDLDEMIDAYDIDVVEHDRDEFIRRIQATLDMCKVETSSIDFDDMVWYPNLYKLKVKTYDVVLVDEFQDLNESQIQFSMQLCKKKGRIFCYGDRNQAIYNFRGANAASVFSIIETLKPKLLPLSISYRCPVSVVAEAQKYVPEIQAAPGAKHGTVQTITESEMYKLAKPGSFIVSRTNAPMLSIALKFIKMGIPANIRGRDIGQNLLTFIQNSKAKTIPALKEYIDKWATKESERLLKKGKDLLPVTDKAECLRVLVEDCKDVEQVKSRMQKLFSDEDDKSKVLLTSTHRVKGDQNPNVFVLWGTFFGDDQEAQNLRYVAITRSQDKLYFVKSVKIKANDDDSED